MDTKTNYRIRLKGSLDERWLRWFDGLTISVLPNGETLIMAEEMDQAALHGILNRIRDLGIELLSLEQYKLESGSIANHDSKKDKQ